MQAKALIIPAAGAGKRMQRELPKPFIRLGDKTILEHTLSRFLSLKGLQRIVVSTSAEYVDRVEQILAKVVGDEIEWQCVEGGSERQHSIYNALKVIEEVDLVLVHDAVRPFIKPKYIDACCQEAEKHGAAIVGIPVKNTIKKVDKNKFVEATPDRHTLWQVQTPQIFNFELLKKTYGKAIREGFLGTDDASLVEWLGEPVKVVKGDVSNIKITYPKDLKLAQLILNDKNE